MFVTPHIAVFVLVCVCRSIHTTHSARSEQLSMLHKPPGAGVDRRREDSLDGCLQSHAEVCTNSTTLLSRTFDQRPWLVSSGGGGGGGGVTMLRSTMFCCECVHGFFFPPLTDESWDRPNINSKI